MLKVKLKKSAEGDTGPVFTEEEAALKAKFEKLKQKKEAKLKEKSEAEKLPEATREEDALQEQYDRLRKKKARASSFFVTVCCATHVIA